MQTINKLRYLILLTVLLSGCTKSKAVVPDPGTSTSAFRVIGYLRDYNVIDGYGASYDYSRVTHINIAFVNPDKDGNIVSLDGLATVVKAAHSKNVKVLASIGGGLAPAYYTTLLADANRTAFINKLIQFTTSNNLDGVDVDLEGPRIDENYEAFITELSAALKPMNKLLTAAVATSYSTQYTDKALAGFDFINIMSYDKTGPWNPAKPGQHAPYSMAEDDLEYWGTTRGIAKEKLNLGLPFYGYGFGGTAPEDMSFAGIAKQYPEAVNLDEISVGGGTVYYNGIATIVKKTQLALQKSGGVMVWELKHDATAPYSLLDHINATIKASAAN